MFRLLDENFIVIDCYNNINDLYSDAFDLIKVFKKLYYTSPHNDVIKKVDLVGYKLAPNYVGEAIIFYDMPIELPILNGSIIKQVGPHWQTPNFKATYKNEDKYYKYIYYIRVKNLIGYRIDYNNISNLVKFITNANELHAHKEEIYSYKDIEVLHIEKCELNGYYNLYIIEGKCVDNII